MLNQSGLLSSFLTDSWIPSPWQSIVSRFSESLSLRHHQGIPDSLVQSATVQRVLVDLIMRGKGLKGWDGIDFRNSWFQRWSANQVEKCDSGTDVCFSYSYTALAPFRAARKRGMACVLGQIDPGPLELEIVDSATKQYSNLKLGEENPPARYWESWRKELQIADLIIVNSEWSKDLLIRQGVEESKLEILPLTYERPAHSAPTKAVKHEASMITVLFLGQIILRKGLGQLFDAIRLLSRQPIRFLLAGPVGIGIPGHISANPNVEILGAVDRLKANALYQESDVFILPTLSDGFAITQLEALAHGLPLVVSRYCGSVAKHGVNGLILDEVTPQEIVKALTMLLDHSLLSELKAGAKLTDSFKFNEVASQLSHLISL